MPKLVLLAIAALAPAFSAYQQQESTEDSTRITTRTIEGSVLTKSGVPVPGAVVLLKDSKTLQVRSYIAQKNGLYHFFGLSTDVNYELRAENQGLTSKEKNVSVFDSQKTVQLDLKLTRKVTPAKKKKVKNKEANTRQP